MEEHFSRRYCQIFYQSLGILLLAVLLALVVNQLRSDPIPLIADWSPEAQLVLDSGDNLAISLEEAQMLFFENRALFLDARSPELYRMGHIEGAKNLPWEQFDIYFDTVMSDVPPETPIVTYCDGDGCSLSKELALVLLDMGYTNVHVLVNGWSAWRESGLPVEADSASAS